MKRIKLFNAYNEAVILPPKVKFKNINNMATLKNQCKINDIVLTHYDEFLEGLSDADKKTAPPKGDPRAPFFALFNPILKKPHLVINSDPGKNPPYLFGILNKYLEDIIGHELIHKAQSERRSDDLVFNLPTPTDMANYFSNPDEIMAFSYSIAKDLIKSGKSKTINQLISGLKFSNMWDDITSNCSEEVINKYKKYIYNYLVKFKDDSITESKIARLASTTNDKFRLIFKDDGHFLWVYNDTIYIFFNGENLYIFKNQPNYNNKAELIKMLNNINPAEMDSYFEYDADMPLDENLFSYYYSYNNCIMIYYTHTEDFIEEVSATLNISLDMARELEAKITNY